MYYRNIKIEGTLTHRTANQSWIRSSNLREVLDDNLIIVDGLLPGTPGITRYRLIGILQDKPHTALRVTAAAIIAERPQNLSARIDFSRVGDQSEPVVLMLQDRDHLIDAIFLYLMDGFRENPDATWAVPSEEGLSRLIFSTATIGEKTWYRCSEPDGESQKVTKSDDLNVFREVVVNALVKHLWPKFGVGLEDFDGDKW